MRTNDERDLRREIGLLWLVLALLVSMIWVTRSSGNPFTCDDAANTCTYRATAIEPTKKVGGAVLDNYKQTNLKASSNGGIFTTIIKPATSLSGGGTVTQDYTFATVACGVATLTVKASGTNTLSVEGPDTAPVTVTRDRTLDPTCAPMAPTLKVE